MKPKTRSNFAEKIKAAKPDRSDVEHDLKTIANDRDGACWWECSCGERGILVRDILAEGKVFVTARERAENAFEFHVALMNVEVSS